ncbi:flagellar motor protein MotA [Sphingorhabdus lutea]|uniref:Biopolymer transport protein ExbB n=1 Tax=Sphingorhabdus lutea TaxID=1913578 RepID=A0A1L3JAJ2_9SPHN|nr:MotA/TolQ/ExbB proton channel family protein [Sphingorhabdus lutea]APG62138.1 flagellar motor protein MotA [Sphingorhabdus lutea]
MDLEILAAAGAATKKSFGFVEALKEGGWPSWTILATLVVMSIGSFYILFTKLIDQNKVLKQSKEVKANFWRAAGLQEGAAKLEKNSAYRQLVDDGIAAREQHGLLTDPVEAHDWLHGAMNRSQESINNFLNGGLSFLATVGATAPFVGLLGTVIGIYSALIKIGITGDASLDKVSGPVGEALIMTAIGLFVAVPAVFAYNWLQARNKTIARDMALFSNDVLGFITSGGKVKPAVTAAPAAAVKKPAPAAPVKK